MRFKVHDKAEIVGNRMKETSHIHAESYHSFLPGETVEIGQVDVNDLELPYFVSNGVVGWWVHADDLERL